MDRARYTIPSPMVSGPGSLGELRRLLSRCGMKRPLLVTDAGISSSGILDSALEALGPYRDRASVFDRVSPNSQEAEVYEGLKVYRSEGSDGVVAVGGGSVLDAAKGIRLLSCHEGRIRDYDLLSRGMAKVVNPLPPMIAVPTTAGTGSEVSQGALIVTRVDGVTRKTIIGGQSFVPDWAILDAKLTVSLPPALTAGTGMDALTHCVEEYVSPQEHPTVSALAIDSLRRISRDLPIAWRDPDNLRARNDMLLSAMMAGVGFEKGLGVIHAMAHAVGAIRDIHHGLLCAVLLPTGVEFNSEQIAKETAQELARAMGATSQGRADALERFVDALRLLNSELGIPTRLRDLGVPESDCEQVLDGALEDYCLRTNPRPCGRGDLLELWERAW